MSKLNQNTKFILWDSILEVTVMRLEEQLIGLDPEAAQNVNVANAVRAVKAVKAGIKESIDVNLFLGGKNESK